MNDRWVADRLAIIEPLPHVCQSRTPSPKPPKNNFLKRKEKKWNDLFGRRRTVNQLRNDACSGFGQGRVNAQIIFVSKKEKKGTSQMEEM